MRASGPLDRLRQRALGIAKFRARGRRLAQPLITLHAQRGDLRLHPVARVDDESDFGLEAADLGIRLVQAALSALQSVARGVMRHPLGLQLRLELTQPRRLRFQIELGEIDRTLLPALLRLGVVFTQQPKQLLLFLALGLQRFVLLRDHRLRLEFVEVGRQLSDNVFHPDQVLARVMKPGLGLAAALLVLGDTGGLFQKDSQFLRLRLDDPGNHPLPNDCVGPRAKPRSKENILDIAPPGGQVVDVIAGRAIAGEYPLHGDFAVLAPLSRGTPVGIVEDQFDACPAARLAVGRAVENYILHRLAAQLRGPRFTEHPAHGVDDVGFAASIGSHHADQLAWHLKMRGIDE